MITKNYKFSISELVSTIKLGLEEQFSSVIVQGEISNLSVAASGHTYFTLSDSKASLSAVMFKADTFRSLEIKKMQEGEKVICVGSLSVYEKRGTFQIIVRTIYREGTGELKIQWEALKKKLSQQGIFDLQHKKKIPSFPKRIAVITALQGAALQDFLQVFSRRSLWMDILVIPALVQGKDAPASLIQALLRAQKVSAEKKIDVLVFTRGGGSLEDLWAFNDEELVLKIFECPIPVVSAVGHEIDYTLTDLVADVRCETPSSAAELLSSAQEHLTQKILTIKRRLFLWQREWTHRYKNRLLTFSLKRDALRFLDFYEKNMRLDENLVKLKNLMREHFYRKSLFLQNKGSFLKALSPSGVLQRGYTYLQDKEGRIIESYHVFLNKKPQELFSIHFADGVGQAQIASQDKR